MSDGLLPFSPACERNKGPILEVIRRWLPSPLGASPLRALEVGSGSGQHVVHLARHLAGVHWQPTERADSIEGLERRLAIEGHRHLAPAARIQAPLRLDVSQSDWPIGPFDLVFSANTLHIMAATAVPQLLAGSVRVLRPGARLFLYGPFQYGGVHTAESNAGFDAHLRSLDPAMGVRDALALTSQAEALGLRLLEDEAMPAQNRMLIYQRITGL